MTELYGTYGRPGGTEFYPVPPRHRALPCSVRKDARSSFAPVLSRAAVGAFVTRVRSEATFLSVSPARSVEPCLLREAVRLHAPIPSRTVYAGIPQMSLGLPTLPRRRRLADFAAHQVDGSKMSPVHTRRRAHHPVH